MLGQEAGKGLLFQPGLFLSSECLTQNPLLFLSKNTQALTINVSSIAQANGVYTSKPSDFLDFTCFSVETP